MSQVRPKRERVGEIAAKAVVQLLFATGKSFTVDGGGSPGTACHGGTRQRKVNHRTHFLQLDLALVGLQLRILNGVVSLLTTWVENKALGTYVSERALRAGAFK
jgi:hypothetical protein